MEENKEVKVDTEELKTEATNTVNQVKDTIKKVDIKKDSMETKGFVVEIFKNPLEKIQEIVAKDNNKHFTYALIIIAIWMAANLIAGFFSMTGIFSASMRFLGISSIGKEILGIVKVTIQPILTVIIMSLAIFVMNQKNKKSLITVITAVTVANIPSVIAAVVGLLSIIGSQVRILTSPLTQLCTVISTILMYFAAKSISGEEKNSNFIKKFIIIQAIFYGAYIIIGLLGIYI